MPLPPPVTTATRSIEPTDVRIMGRTPLGTRPPIRRGFGRTSNWWSATLIRVGSAGRLVRTVGMMARHEPPPRSTYHVGSMSSRPFRFMTGVGQPKDHREMVESARRAESLGYDVMVYSDHLPSMAPLPVLVAIAEATSRLRVGTFVLNNDLRHPAVLAQELATIDLLTGGRLEIGLGAGWNRLEYERAGIPFDPVGTRVGRMEEAIHVLKGLFGDGPFSFEGDHYRIVEMDGA